MTQTLSWIDGNVPVSARFDDTYFSKQGGRDEVRHVFLNGNGLPGRWQGRNRFVVGELGFGTGLSFLETAFAWRGTALPEAQLEFVSFEKYPVGSDGIRKTMSSWPELMPLCEELCDSLVFEPGWNSVNLGAIRLTLAIGDVNDLIDAWEGLADAWFLDGFSPNKNPDMWSEGLMTKVGARTLDGGTFATFTAAGWVRRNLQNAGFRVRKSPGYGRKREMASGVKSSSGDLKVD